jgi:hypothetical protein
LSTTTYASSSSGHFRSTASFLVQVNFDILLFEGQINAYALDKWLNILKFYFSFHNFFDRENITFTHLKDAPHVKNWWGNYCEKRSIEDSEMFEVEPTWEYFMDVVIEQYYLEEGEYLFHSKMRVKGTPLQFIVDSRSQKNIISIAFIKKLDMKTTPHMHPYNIEWIFHG